MSFRHLDRFAGTPSPITRLPPVVRLLGAVVVALGVSMLPIGAWSHLLAMAILAGALSVAARMPVQVLLLRLSAPFAFVFLASVAVLFLVPGDAVVTLGSVSVTDAGLERFGSVLGRAAVALTAAVVLVSTTRFHEMVHALHALHLPSAVTVSLGLAYRLLYVTVDEVERIQRAARSRNAGAGAAKRRQLLVGVAGAVMRRSLVRSERTHRAMVARGFRGDFVGLYGPALDGRSVLVLAILILVVASVTISAHVVN